MKFNAREIAGSVVARIMGQDEDLPMAPEIEKAIKEAYLAGRREQAEIDAKEVLSKDYCQTFYGEPTNKPHCACIRQAHKNLIEVAKKIGSVEEK